MTILGIDPGSRRIGYGAVTEEKGVLALRGTGILKIASRSDLAALEEIQRGIRQLVRKHAPECVAVERIYFAKNRKTGIAVAQARGVILTTAHSLGVKIIEVSPNEVKAGIAGYGHADKRAVAKMVRLFLHEPRLRVIDDASDALAIAIFALGLARKGHCA